MLLSFSRNLKYKVKRLFRFISTSFGDGTGNNLSERLKKRFGITVYNPHLYDVAFTHRSLSIETPHLEFGVDNERLEYLGDAVLGMVVAEYLFKKFPQANEGWMSEMRSKLVNRQYLNFLARKIGLKDFVVFDKSLLSNGDPPGSIYGNALEAFIGAIYLDHGMEFTRTFIVDQILHEYADVKRLARKELNFKSRIIEWAQQEKKKIDFRTDEVKDENKQSIFYAEVFVEGESLGKGEGLKKKHAEQKASREAYHRLRNK